MRKVREILMKLSNLIIFILKIGHENWIPSSTFQAKSKFQIKFRTFIQIDSRIIFFVMLAFSYNIEQKSKHF